MEVSGIMARVSTQYKPLSLHPWIFYTVTEWGECGSGLFNIPRRYTQIFIFTKICDTKYEIFSLFTLLLTLTYWLQCSGGPYTGLFMHIFYVSSVIAKR